MAEAWQDIPATNSKTSTYIPYNGYFVQATYFLTGEQITGASAWSSRSETSAWPRARCSRGHRDPWPFQHARIGKEIFTAGFSDPNLWSNHVWATDVGLNWYLNFYTKLYLDWQHSEFGSPVVIGPNQFGPTRDLFWLRFQVFF